MLTLPGIGRFLTIFLMATPAQALLPQPVNALGVSETGQAEKKDPSLNVADGDIVYRYKAVTSVLAPEYTVALLSLGLPGTSQFYLDDPLRGIFYLGFAGAASVGIYSLLSANLSEFQRKDQTSQAFVGLISLGGILLVGTASTIDALTDISSRYAAAEEMLVAPAASKPPEPPKTRRKNEADL